LQEMPENSHFHADFLASFESLKAFFGSGFFADNWDTRIWTYVKLRKDHAPENMAYGLSVLADKYVEKSSSDWVGLALQPLMSIHLHREGSVEVEMGQSRNPASLYILSALGVVILLIACINFMSLTTARSATRAREVGVRKVIGGHRSQLIKQFLGESILLSCVALVFAFALMELLLPTFNGLVGKKLDFNYLDNPVLLLLMVGVAVVVGLIAGSYPAFFLSAFLPVQVLKGLVHRGSKGNWFRRVLVVFQFVLSVILIVSTIVLYQQHHFLTNKDLGFDKEHVISVPLSFLPNRARNYELFKHELLRNPRISGVTSSTNKPGVTDHNGIQIRASGSAEDRGIGIIYVDHDCLETLDIELAAGRDFSKDIASDTKHAILLNESAREFLGAEFGPGKLVELFWRMQDKIVPVYDGTIIGVVRDFNHHPLDIRPQPIVFAIAQADWNYRQALIRIGPQSIPETVHFIQAQWQRLFPDQPFRFSFLAQDIEQVYRPLRRWQTIFGYFALLAVFIACLGLFGLASFATEQRTKEIGIRKILGASVSGIVLLLSKEFTKLVLVSNLIAWPVAYWAMNRWLQDFAYRIPIGVETFVLAGVLALIIALLTVSFQAVKAATANPVQALRYE
ncbi:MAG: FtsX-like permease family protein, partial [Candidatus Latescibacteria bacterium]|nr:FtsX-like permease family protein [Candidatus Latescibacterota bacterium]